MQKAVLVDLDNTLLSKTPEEEIPGFTRYSPEYWQKWYEMTMTARALPKGVEKFWELKTAGYQMIAVTARGSAGLGRPLTIKKLREIGIWKGLDGLWMRPISMEGMAPSEFKNLIIPRVERARGVRFAIAMEDTNHAVMRRHGIKVIDANEWNTL